LSNYMSRRFKESIPTAVADEMREIEDMYADDDTYGTDLSAGQLNKLEERYHLLGKRLGSLTVPQLNKLELDTELQETVKIFISAGNGPAKRRVMQRIRTLIRANGHEYVEAALNGRGAAEDNTALLEYTRKKLIAGGDQALHAFALENPSVDRVQLRQLIRSAQGDGAKANKAFKSIYVLLKEII
jgi:ribosome-associated protein